MFNCLLLESVFWIGVSDPLYIAVRSGGCGRFDLLRVRPGECVPSPGHESLLVCVCVCVCVHSTRYFIFCRIKSGTGDWNPSPFKADKSLFILLVHLLWHYVEDIQSTHTSGSLRIESLCRSVVYARHIINQAILCKYRIWWLGEMNERMRACMHEWMNEWNRTPCKDGDDSSRGGGAGGRNSPLQYLISLISYYQATR